VENERTGSVVYFSTSDISSAFGWEDCDIFALDEVTHWRAGGDRLWDAMYSSAGKRADAVLIGLANAGFDGTWQRRLRDAVAEDSTWSFSELPGCVASWITPKTLADQERYLSPSAYRRVWQNCWSTGAGDALPAHLIEKCCCLPGPMVRRDPAEYPISGIAVDLGLTNHHAAVVVLLGSYRQRKPFVARVVDFAPPVSIVAVGNAITQLAHDVWVKCIILDPWQGMQLAQQLAAMGYIVQPEHPTPTNQQRQAAALLQSIREDTLAYYPDPLLLEDLRNVSVVERGYGERLQFASNQNGHGDRLAALASILPSALEALGQPPPARHRDVINIHGMPVHLGHGDSILKVLDMAERFEDRLDGLGW